MIRMRRLLPALGVAVLVVAFAPRSPDPAAAAAADALVQERALAAEAALDGLAGPVATGVDAARLASAAVVSGDGSPERRIAEASVLIRAAEERVIPARRSVTGLAAALGARDPAAPIPSRPVEAGELAAIADQLEAAVPAAVAFASLRQRATGLPGQLEEVIRLLDAGALEDARARVEAARDDHAALEAWDTDLPTLPVWIATTDAMITAVEDIVSAVAAGDAAAAAAAAAEFGELGEEAAQADRALRIAIGEGGSAVLAAPLERLASVMRGIDSTRSAVAPHLPSDR